MRDIAPQPPMPDGREIETDQQRASAATEVGDLTGVIGLLTKAAFQKRSFRH
jgi:hypothetical protein